MVQNLLKVLLIKPIQKKAFLVKFKITLLQNLKLCCISNPKKEELLAEEGIDLFEDLESEST